MPFSLVSDVWARPSADKTATLGGSRSGSGSGGGGSCADSQDDSPAWDRVGGNDLGFGDGVVIGIDLGTTNSCAAVWHLDKGRVKVSKYLSHARTSTRTG